jgi:hypothetical protein
MAGANRALAVNWLDCARFYVCRPSRGLSYPSQRRTTRVRVV